jgi:ferric-dicitrate binding protein FerR (iron transport regulator)
VKNNISKEALLRKYINNECSSEELELLFEYLRTSQADPQLHAIIEAEIQKINYAQDKQDKVDEGQAAEMYGAIRKAIQEKSKPVVRGSSSWFQFSHPWRVAATLTGILISAVVAYYFLKDKSEVVSYATAFGQTAKVVLPDSSVITLNGNSSIQYISGWSDKVPREVWLKGEAFFSVKHTYNHQKFLVHTSDKFNVEVLGTEFNVYNRNAKTRVVLNSGKVTLNMPESAKQNRLTMEPGELVEFEDSPSQFVKRGVNTAIYSSWINKKLILDNTSFREIALLLEETYGLSVVVPDKSLYEERFTGIVPCENAGMLLNAVALSFNLTIQKKGNQVKFQPR